MSLNIFNNIDCVMHFKNNLDICRCCLSASTAKEITDCEDFVAMLQDTFNIELCHQELPGKQILCDECVSKLHNAHHFKEMVLRSEQMLSMILKGISNGTDNKQANMSFDGVIPVPVEVADEFGDRCDDGSSLEDEPLSVIKKEINDEMQYNFGDPMHTTHEQETKSVKSKTRRGKVKKKSSNAKPTKPDKDWAKITAHRGNGPLLRENSLKLIENSTACVFQWFKSKYTCFCCKQPFLDMEQLRAHTRTEHTIKNIEKKIILQQNQMVKVEISVLNCKLCDKRLQNLKELKEHLSSDHNFEFRLKEDLLVPFKIQDEGLQCQICLENFTMFRLLNIHMNRHYQKQVCHVCGAAFSNLKFLNLHKTRVHKKLSCKRCKIEFTTKSDKRNHDITVHNIKLSPKSRFPCPHCDARFVRENLKVLHLVEEHGMKKPEYICGYCPKSFITKSLCNNHVKSVHMKERKHGCSICHRRFYSACDVTRHRATHVKDKKFSCALCNGPFASKDSLRRHMKRTHAAMLNST